MDEIKKRKEEISNITKATWATNCSFSFDEVKPGVNLRVCKDIGQLIGMAAFLTSMQESYLATAEDLEVEDVPDFTHSNFTVEDQVHDIKLRIDQIQIEAKKKKLEKLEARLDKIISPEMRAELELEAIMKEMGN